MASSSPDCSDAEGAVASYYSVSDLSYSLKLWLEDTESEPLNFLPYGRSLVGRGGRRRLKYDGQNPSFDVRTGIITDRPLGSGPGKRKITPRPVSSVSPVTVGHSSTLEGSVASQDDLSWVRLVNLQLLPGPSGGSFRPLCPGNNLGDQAAAPETAFGHFDPPALQYTAGPSDGYPHLRNYGNIPKSDVATPSTDICVDRSSLPHTAVFSDDTAQLPHPENGLANQATPTTTDNETDGLELESASLFQGIAAAGLDFDTAVCLTGAGFSDNVLDDEGPNYFETALKSYHEMYGYCMESDWLSEVDLTSHGDEGQQLEEKGGHGMNLGLSRGKNGD